MGEKCEHDRLGESKILSTRKGRLKTRRVRKCNQCEEEYSTVEEREDVRYLEKTNLTEEIMKLEDENFGLRRLLQGASGAVRSLTEYYKEVDRIREE